MRARVMPGDLRADVATRRIDVRLSANVPVILAIKDIRYRRNLPRSAQIDNGFYVANRKSAKRKILYNNARSIRGDPDDYVE